MINQEINNLLVLNSNISYGFNYTFLNNDILLSLKAIARKYIQSVIYTN